MSPAAGDRDRWTDAAVPHLGPLSGLVTDLYELNMAQAYWTEGHDGIGVFDLFIRTLPDRRNVLVACGLDEALAHLEHVRFGDEAIEWLRERGEHRDDWLDHLRDYRFTGSVMAVPDGTPVFAGEPILRVAAPIEQAQLAETALMNIVQVHTLLASKAVRVVHAADGRNVVDFGLRRMHGIETGLRAARAFHTASVAATSNVHASKVLGVPCSGTMAHAFVQAHRDEYDAFRRYAALYPDTILLVDTYDTLEGVRNVIRLAEEMGDDFRVRGIRLDSGDLVELSRKSRRLLDDAGLEDVKIVVSGGLDESSIADIVAADAPVDGFGVGTRMAVSRDAPSSDIVYKLAEYAGEGRLKLSTGKATLPGRKQVWRVEPGGAADHDVLGLESEDPPPGGRPLLQTVMEDGRRTDAADDACDPDAARERCRRELDALPDRIRDLEPADPPYEVRISAALEDEAARVRAELS